MEEQQLIVSRSITRTVQLSINWITLSRASAFLVLKSPAPRADFESCGKPQLTLKTPQQAKFLAPFIYYTYINL